MSQSLQVLMVFVDGLGLGPSHPELNPVHAGQSPHLEALLRDEAVPIDASLDTPGLPQSATGQATLFTGQNAAQHVGRHVEGCPGPTLKRFVREHNLYDQLAERGKSSTFANAYYVRSVAEVEKMRRQSVTTVAALKAFGSVRLGEELTRNQAVYQDLTREVLSSRGYTGPTIAPEEAGSHLVGVADQFDFTLFEYFQTDLMAHRGTEEDVHRVLSELDRFLEKVTGHWVQPGRLFLLTSDHGNVEDLRTRHHTSNPVPLVAMGEGAERFRERIKRLEDVTPVIVDACT